MKTSSPDPRTENSGPSGVSSRNPVGCAGRLVRAWGAVERLHLALWRSGAANVRRYGKPRWPGWLGRG